MAPYMHTNSNTQNANTGIYTYLLHDQPAGVLTDTQPHMQTGRHTYMQAEAIIHTLVYHHICQRTYIHTGRHAVRHPNIIQSGILSSWHTH